MSAFLDVTHSNAQDLSDQKRSPTLEEPRFSNGGSPVDDEFPCSDGAPCWRLFLRLMGVSMIRSF
jgi:hypothetical protein